MARLTMRRGGNILELSVGGKPLPPSLQKKFEEALTYTHLTALRGMDAYDEYDNYRPTRAETRTMWTLDKEGRFVASLGWKYRLEEMAKQAGYDVDHVSIDPPHPREDRYRTDWDAMFQRMDLRARQDELLAAIDSVEHGLIDVPPGVGKAQPLDSLLQTPNGPIRMGDVRVGDTLCSVDGATTRVRGVFPRGEMDVYQVCFRDGSSVECCADHLWSVRFRSKAVRGGPSIWREKVIDTASMASSLVAGGKAAYKVQLPAPLHLETKQLPMDPYLMGFLLGDGCFRGGSLTYTTADKDLVSVVDSCLPNGLISRKWKSTYTYGIVNADGSRRRNDLRKALKSFGLWNLKSGEKFIPSVYLLNGYSTRLSVVQGLLDTDGYVAKNGTIQYCSISKKLADGFQWLIESIGGICRVKEKVQGVCKSYTCTVSVKTGSDLFRLERKRSRCITRTKYEVDGRIVVSVEPVRRAEVQCISVDHPTSLYLTDHCVPTHNSFVIGAYCLSHPRTRVHVITEGIDILQRLYRHLTKFLPNVGMVGGGKNRFGERVTVISSDSMHKIGEGFNDPRSPRAADTVFFDEVHKAGADSLLAVLARYQRARMYGLSASIDGRFDGAHAQLEGIFGKVVFHMSYQEAVRLKLCAPVHVQWIRNSGRDPVSGLMLPDFGDGLRGVEWDRAVLYRNPWRNQAIASEIYKLPQDLQILIMVSKAEHAAYLQNIMPDFELCYGDMKDYDRCVAEGILDPKRTPPMTPKRRDRMRDDFEAGSLRRVIATDVWSTGVDFVNLSVVARADARSSPIMDIQIPGRANRFTDDKEYALLLDVNDEADPGLQRRTLGRRRNYVKYGWTQSGWIGSMGRK